MKISTGILISDLLTRRSEARMSSDGAMAEPYCASHGGGAPSASGMVSTTMILGGTTWTAMSTVATLSSNGPAASLNATATATSVTMSGTNIATDGMPTISLATSRGTTSDNKAPTKVSMTPSSVSSSSLGGTSSGTGGDASSGSSIAMPPLNSVTPLSSNGAANPANTPFPPVFSPTPPRNDSATGSGGAVVMPTESLPPATPGDGKAGSASERPQASSIAPSLEGSVSAGPSVGLSTEGLNKSNGTRTDTTAALQLALFLKNLEVSLFSLNVSRPTDTTALTPTLVGLVANISQQENTQRTVLQTLLRQTGGEAIPPCQYDFPTNATELLLLMHALKSIEVGIQLWRSEPLPSLDRAVDRWLSSTASVAAKQDALLHAAASGNTSLTPLDPPLPDVWAYNLALAYVRPGSCARELPIPLLPALTMDNKTAGFAPAGGSITFGWNAAAKAAIARSGRPLSVAWVNQASAPLYTSLVPIGDAMGAADVPASISGTTFAALTAQPGIVDLDELADATIAGPVMVKLVG